MSPPTPRRPGSRARADGTAPSSPAIAAERGTACTWSRRTSRTTPTTSRASWCSAARRRRRAGKDPTSLVLFAPNRPGAVCALIAPFAKHGVNMSTHRVAATRRAAGNTCSTSTSRAQRAERPGGRGIGSCVRGSRVPQGAGLLSCSGPRGRMRIAAINAADPWRGARRRTYARSPPTTPGKPIAALDGRCGLDEANIVKLASNEEPVGPVSPRARAAIEAPVPELGAPRGLLPRAQEELVEILGVAGARSSSATARTRCSRSARGLSSGPGDHHRVLAPSFAVYPLARRRAARAGSWRRREAPTGPTSPRHPRGDEARDAPRVPRQPQQPDRDAALARGAIAERASRAAPTGVVVIARRGLRGVRAGPRARYDSLAWLAPSP